MVEIVLGFMGCRRVVSEAAEVGRLKKVSEPSVAAEAASNHVHHFTCERTRRGIE